VRSRAGPAEGFRDKNNPKSVIAARQMVAIVDLDSVKEKFHESRPAVR
jgi:hypothetical protein